MPFIRLAELRGQPENVHLKQGSFSYYKMIDKKLTFSC